MCILRTATFTMAIDSVSEDELEAAAAAFTCTLHRAGLTPADALDAWRRLDRWEARGFTPDDAPDACWQRSMRVASDAVVAAMRAAGIEGQRRPFVIQP